MNRTKGSIAQMISIQQLQHDIPTNFGFLFHHITFLDNGNIQIRMRDVFIESTPDNISLNYSTAQMDLSISIHGRQRLEINGNSYKNINRSELTMTNSMDGLRDFDIIDWWLDMWDDQGRRYKEQGGYCG